MHAFSPHITKGEDDQQSSPKHSILDHKHPCQQRSEQIELHFDFQRPGDGIDAAVRRSEPVVDVEAVRQ